MKYKTLGKTNMNVSAMTLGTWGMGGVGWDYYDNSIRLDAIATAYEHGVNFFDTAPAYNNGAAERLLGSALHDLGIRNNIKISTKCGNLFVDGKVYKRDGRYDTIIHQCEESLKNLRTDYIDLMLIHWPDPNTPFEETLSALNTLKKEGKILHIGVSNFSMDQIQEAEKFGSIEVYQPQYSMVNRLSETEMKWAYRGGIGIMTYGSLGGGILSGKYRSLQEFSATDSRNRFYPYFKEPAFSKIMHLLDIMDEISHNNGNIPLSHIALSWSCRHDFVSTCIIGSQSRSNVEENAKAFDFTLSDADLIKLDNAIEAFSLIS